MPEPHVIAGKIYAFVWDEALRRFKGRDKYSDEEMKERIETMILGVGRKWAERRGVRRFSNKQIERGIAVEKEHTDSDMIAANIMLDHLEEFDDYYDFLDLMELLMKKRIPIQDVRLALHRAGLPVNLR